MLKFSIFYLLNVSWRSNCLARFIMDVFLLVNWIIYKYVLLKVYWYFIFKKNQLNNSERHLKEGN